MKEKSEKEFSGLQEKLKVIKRPGKIQDANEKFRVLFEISPDIIFVQDNEGIILDVNLSACRLFGLKYEEIIDSNIEKFIKHNPNSTPFISNNLISGMNYYESTIADTNENLIPVEIISNFIRYNNTDAKLIIVRDISKRKLAEQRLYNTEMRMASLFRNAPKIVLYETGRDKEFISGNIHQLLGFMNHNINCKKDIESLIHKDDFPIVKLKIKKWMESEDKNELSVWYRLFKNDGTLLWIEDRMVKVVSGTNEKYITGVIMDNTNLKTVEENLKVSYQKLQKLLQETVTGLIAAVEIRDPYTAGHQKRVTSLAIDISKEMNLGKDVIDGICIAASIHDIGKINIPSGILSKPGKLSSAEFDLIKVHPVYGYEILKNIEFPWPIAEIVLQHHERYDGSSYPRGLHGEEILLEARIICVADVIESMVSHRPYRPALGIIEAIEEIHSNKGTLYDPKVVDACTAVFNNGFRFEDEKAEMKFSDIFH
jgi:PAS domain S-box-containing protein